MKKILKQNHVVLVKKKNQLSLRVNIKNKSEGKEMNKTKCLTCFYKGNCHDERIHNIDTRRCRAYIKS